MIPFIGALPEPEPTEVRPHELRELACGHLTNTACRCKALNCPSPRCVLEVGDPFTCAFCGAETTVKRVRKL